METDQDTETTPSDSFPASKRKMSPRSLANLAPAWNRGTSGNPSGLTKDGKSTRGRALEASLLEQLAKPGAMEQVAKSWIKHAKKGSAAHLSLLLDRLYPAIKDMQQGKQVMEGIRLEFAPDGGASVTVLRGSGAGELREIDETGVPGGGLAREACGLAGETQALEALQESPPQQPLLLEGSETPETPREVSLEETARAVG